MEDKKEEKKKPEVMVIHKNANEIQISLDVLKELLGWKLGESYLILLNDVGQWTVSKPVVKEKEDEDEQQGDS